MLRKLFGAVVGCNTALCKDVGLLLLRIWFGGLMVYGHGWGKLARFQELAPRFSDPIGIGSPASLSLTIFAEVFCAIAVMLGLLTRAAAIPLAIAMAVAGFVVHSADPFARKELALVYLGAWLILLIAGAGRFSIDAWLAGAVNKTR